MVIVTGVDPCAYSLRLFFTTCLANSNANQTTLFVFDSVEIDAGLQNIGAQSGLSFDSAMCGLLNLRSMLRSGLFIRAAAEDHCGVARWGVRPRAGEGFV